MKATRFPFSLRFVVSFLLAFSFLFVPLSTVSQGIASANDKIVYPGTEWEKRDPKEMGLDMEALKQIGELMEKAKANGVLIHKGYLVADWNYAEAADQDCRTCRGQGGPDQRFETQSITKSITGAILGLALMDALIPNLDAKVKEHYPSFDVGPYSDEITFRHLVSVRSGVVSRIAPTVCPGPNYLEPGTHRYNSDDFQHLSQTLTYLFEKQLTEVLQERILTPLQTQDVLEWETHPDGRGEIPGFVVLVNGKSVPVQAGYSRSYWSARDLARIGYLFLRGGQWDGKQILPSDYVAECWKPTRSGGQVRNYGLAWWVNNTEKGENTGYMLGRGDQFCMVSRDHDLVLSMVLCISKSKANTRSFWPPFFSLAPQSSRQAPSPTSHGRQMMTEETDNPNSGLQRHFSRFEVGKLPTLEMLESFS